MAGAGKHSGLLAWLTFLSAGEPSTAAGEQREAPADLVLLRGKIVTVDDRQPEAEALAVRKDTIVAVGSNEAIRKYIGPSTQVLDLQGNFAMPGFIDGHGHLLRLGQIRLELDLSKAASWNEVIAIVEEKIRQTGPGEWILATGWHQEKWLETPAPNVEGYPTAAAMDRISPDNPVMLVHASGHARFVNAKVLEMAGVTRATADPVGGRILREANGQPTGIFFDSAMELVTRAYADDLAQRTPEQVESQSRQAIRQAVQECLTKGVTSFQDAASSFRTIELYKRMVDDQELGIRLWAMIREKQKDLLAHAARYKIINYGDRRLTVRAIKKFMDGAVGSHTAWLLKPYSDLPGSTGLNVQSVEEILETARFAATHGFQLCVHAIEDRANRETLNVYQQAFREAAAGGRELRWRIEHVQHLDGADIPRFAELGVIASMQAIHCTSDGPWVAKRIGAERTEEGAYVWQKLIQSGAVVTNGTDAPVEDMDPIANFYAAVTRKLEDGTRFYPDQCMTREQALRAATINNAFAAFEDDIKGSLTPGKLADITILSGNLLNVPEDEIKNIRVLYTIVGGQIMYRREAGDH